MPYHAIKKNKIKGKEMNESVAVAKEADAKKGFSSTHRSDEGIPLVRDERGGQLGSLRGVICDIRRNGARPRGYCNATG